MVFSVGITGEIGSGKTTVINIFDELKEQIFVADNYVNYLYSQEEVIKSIEIRIPEIVISNKIDKFKLRSMVINKPYTIDILEEIIHPLVIKKLSSLVSSGNKTKLFFAEIPLLFETGFNSIFEVSITVCCDKDEREKRLNKRNGKNQRLLEILSKRHYSSPDKVSRSHFSIINSYGIDFTRRQVYEVFRILYNRSINGKF